MGNLKPDTKYIYERAEGIIYAREFGADPSTREIIGYDHDPITGHRIDRQTLVQENQLWQDIRRAAHTNPSLQDALERAIVIYKLSKTDE